MVNPYVQPLSATLNDSRGLGRVYPGPHPGDERSGSFLYKVKMEKQGVACYGSYDLILEKKKKIKK